MNQNLGWKTTEDIMAQKQEADNWRRMNEQKMAMAQGMAAGGLVGHGSLGQVMVNSAKEQRTTRDDATNTIITTELEKIDNGYIATVFRRDMGMDRGYNAPFITRRYIEDPTKLGEVVMTAIAAIGLTK